MYVGGIETGPFVDVPFRFNFRFVALEFKRFEITQWKRKKVAYSAYVTVSPIFVSLLFH